MSEPDSDEVVFDRAKRELRGLDQVETQYEQRILPCTVLLMQDAFYKWRDDFEDWPRKTKTRGHGSLSRGVEEWLDRRCERIPNSKLGEKERDELRRWHWGPFLIAGAGFEPATFGL